jgi:hypothetical protein
MTTVDFRARSIAMLESRNESLGYQHENIFKRWVFIAEGPHPDPVGNKSL